MDGEAKRCLAAALEAPITVMDTAENGGPWGMALLAAYMMASCGLTLEDYLSERVFAGVRSSTLAPDPADIEGFRRYRERFEALLAVERKAIETMWER